MAKIKIRKVKGMKIKKEFIETRFKEVKPNNTNKNKKQEIETDVSKLESEISSSQQENFEDFPATRTAPVLEPTQTNTAQLEATAQTAPPATSNENNNSLYASGTSSAVERGYGQEDYIRRDYNATQETGSAIFAQEERERRDMNQTFTRMSEMQQSAWRPQNENSVWSDQQRHREQEREYENIEMKDLESRRKAEKFRRMAS